jgi:limonene-1,2-epoxide hydrolase
MPEAPLPARVRDALVALRADTLDTLRALYDDDVTFIDPIQTVRGIEPFLAMNRRMFARAREVAFDVTAVVGDDRAFFLAWTARFVAKLGPTLNVDGVSQMRAEAGRVTWHRDYWDVGSLFASGIPGGAAVLELLRRPLA